MKHPLAELLVCRLREFFREPEAIFWVYGFPVLLAIGLGIAFREKPAEQFHVDLDASAPPARLAWAREALKGTTFLVEEHPAPLCAERLRLGRSDLTVVPGEPTLYRYDEARPPSVLARARAHD